jgi:hypothetical protein
LHKAILGTFQNAMSKDHMYSEHLDTEGHVQAFSVGHTVSDLHDVLTSWGHSPSAGSPHLTRSPTKYGRSWRRTTGWILIAASWAGSVFRIVLDEVLHILQFM